MEKLFTKKQIREMIMTAHKDLVFHKEIQFSVRDMKGTSHMNKSQLVGYLKELWNIRNKHEGLGLQ